MHSAILDMTNETILRNVYARLLIEGQLVKPRGLQVLEAENFDYELPPYCRFIKFAARKLNIPYIKKEFMWYLKGQANDVSIAQHAALWNSAIKDDGTINSNYGQYIFGQMRQFDNVVRILTSDSDSRKASIVILTDKHLQSNDADTPCTYSLNFRIRKNYLNMTVRMRSQDAIYGMGSDVPCFSFIHEMILHTLREKYPALMYGMYYHSNDSFHVYEKHWPMLKLIAHDDKFEQYDCPQMSGAAEVRFLRAMEFDEVPDEYQFTKWLIQ